MTDLAREIEELAMTADEWRRFRSFVAVTLLGCWRWNGHCSPEGYGTMWYRGKPTLAHRISYWHHSGAIGNGLELDHLCRVRDCVNPKHLEAVTRRDNQRRGYSITGRNARKQHCLKGHPFDNTNTGPSSRGGRRCRTCTRESQRLRLGWSPERAASEPSRYDKPTLVEALRKLVEVEP